jgi:hypothetical protein
MYKLNDRLAVDAIPQTKTSILCDAEVAKIEYSQITDAITKKYHAILILVSVPKPYDTQKCFQMILFFHPLLFSQFPRQICL